MIISSAQLRNKGDHWLHWFECEVVHGMVPYEFTANRSHTAHSSEIKVGIVRGSREPQRQAHSSLKCFIFLQCKYGLIWFFDHDIVKCNFLSPQYIDGFCDHFMVPLKGRDVSVKAGKDKFLKAISFFKSNNTFSVIQCRLPPCAA